MSKTPSLYFSAFNDKNLIKNGISKSLYEEIECKIKYLLLTKGKLIIPISHILNSPVASKIITDNISLVDKGIINIMMRNNVVNIDEMIKADSKISPKLYNPTLIKLLRDRQSCIGKFSLEKSEGIVKERLIFDLSDNEGLLNRWLGEEARKVYDIVIASGIGHLSHHVGHVKEFLSKEQIGQFKAYFDVLYYVAGANAFQTECLLPQANVPSIFDIVCESNEMSDDYLFRDLLLITISKATSIELSKYFIDNISIEDLVTFRENSDSFSQFCNGLDQLHRQVMKPLTLDSPDQLIFELTELHNFRSEIQDKYESQLKKEMKFGQLLKGTPNVSNIIINSLSLAFTPIGLLAALVSIADNSLNLFGASKNISKTINKIRNRLEGSVLLPFAKELFNFQSKKLPTLLK